MKTSFVLSSLTTILLCTSCSNISPEAKKPLEPNIEGPDYQVNFVNASNPIQLKPGPIVCPNEAIIKYVGNSENTVYCYSKAIFFTPDKKVTIDEYSLNKVLICQNSISITGKNKGVCKKAN
jgi:hypothetical protein